MDPVCALPVGRSSSLWSTRLPGRWKTAPLPGGHVLRLTQGPGSKAEGMEGSLGLG